LFESDILLWYELHRWRLVGTITGRWGAQVSGALCRDTISKPLGPIFGLCHHLVLDRGEARRADGLLLPLVDPGLLSWTQKATNILLEKDLVCRGGVVSRCGAGRRASSMTL